MPKQTKSQKEIILEYVDFYGYIIPAKMSGKAWKEYFFGSETGARCRELRKAGILTSEPEGQFEKFFRPRRKFNQTSESYKQDQLFNLPARPAL